MKRYLATSRVLLRVTLCTCALLALILLCQSRDSVAFAQTGAVNLNLTMNDKPDPVKIGENLSFIIVVKNVGATPASNVTVTDSLHASYTYVSTTTQGTATQAGNTITAVLGTLNAGSSATVTILVQPTQTGRFNNTATGNEHGGGQQSRFEYGDSAYQCAARSLTHPLRIR